MEKEREKWNKKFIGCLINLRDLFLEQDSQEIVDSKKCELVEELIYAYFRERRPLVPFGYPSVFMDNEAMAEFINDKVLSYICDEFPNFIELDWRQRYVLKTEIEELLSDGDDGNFA